MTDAKLTRPSARLPLAALVLAAVVSLGNALLPSATPPTAATGTEQESPDTGPTSPPCTDVRQSLRPLDPMPTPGAMPAGSTMADIVERGRLIVGVDQGKYLMGYRDPLTGQLEGSDIDIVHRIATELLGDPDAVQWVVLDIADRVAALEDLRVDMVVNSFAVTCARQRSVEYSTAYMPVTQRLLVPIGGGVREVEDLAGRRICTSAGSTTEEVLENLPVRDLTVLTRPGIPDCVVEMHLGQADAISSDDVLLAGLAAQDPQTEIVGRSLLESTYAVGMRPDQPDLVRFVNGVLENARADGTLAASSERWYAEHLNPPPAVAPARYRD